ncbi:DMT family transporter [candidate division KSB1 bacterium]
MEGIIFGLAAMFFWGISKVILKPALTRIGPYPALVYQYLVTSVFLILVSIPLVDLVKPSKAILPNFIAALFIGAAAIYFYFRALHKGKVSLVSPIAHSSVLITVILSYIFYREILQGKNMIAVILLIIGVVVISFRYSEIKKLRMSKTIVLGAEFAFLTMLGWGLYFFLIKPIVVELGALLAVLYLELGITFLILLPFIFGIIKKKKLISPGTAKPYLLFAGITVALGSLSFNYGIEKAAVSIIYPVANSALLITVIGSYIFLKERVETNQYIATFIILLGLVLVSI